MPPVGEDRRTAWRVPAHTSEAGALQHVDRLDRFLVLKIDDQIDVAGSPQVSMEYDGQASYDDVAAAFRIQRLK